MLTIRLMIGLYSQEMDMELKTEHLLLREFRQADLPAFTAMYEDPLFQRFEPPVGKEEARIWLNSIIMQSCIPSRSLYKLAMTIPPDDTALGMFSLNLVNSGIREWEIGWGVHPSCWGRGYAPESARALLNLAFGELKAHRVVAYCHTENRASVRVMEKLGMRCEGRLRRVRWLNKCWNDEWIYSILDDEWT